MTQRVNLHHQDNFELINDILETLRFHGTVFFNSELSQPWGMTLSKSNSIRFHISVSGQFFLGNFCSEPISVKDQDVVMITQAESHWVADNPGRELVESDLASEMCQLGAPLFQQGKTTHHVICGLISFEHFTQHPFLASLPPVIHLEKVKDNQSVWMLIKLINQIMQESLYPKTGIIDRLAEVLFLQLLANYLQHTERPQGFIAGMQDHRLQQALLLIHRHPEKPWTVNELGKMVGLSRATLIRYFQKHVGLSPMAYITYWRLSKANNAIRNSNETVEQIAEKVGFSSSQSLSKAFKRQYGKSPSEVRKQANKRR